MATTAVSKKKSTTVAVPQTLSEAIVQAYTPGRFDWSTPDGTAAALQTYAGSDDAATALSNGRDTLRPHVLAAVARHTLQHAGRNKAPAITYGKVEHSGDKGINAAGKRTLGVMLGGLGEDMVGKYVRAARFFAIIGRFTVDGERVQSLAAVPEPGSAVLDDDSVRAAAAKAWRIATRPESDNSGQRRGGRPDGGQQGGQQDQGGQQKGGQQKGGQQDQRRVTYSAADMLAYVKAYADHATPTTRDLPVLREARDILASILDAGTDTD